MPDTILPSPDDAIDPEMFKIMIDVRAKALQLAQGMPNTNRLDSIMKKAEEIEAWLTRKT